MTALISYLYFEHCKNCTLQFYIRVNNINDQQKKVYFFLNELLS
jgi:hypothetical protein